MDFKTYFWTLIGYLLVLGVFGAGELYIINLTHTFISTKIQENNTPSPLLPDGTQIILQQELRKQYGSF